MVNRNSPASPISMVQSATITTIPNNAVPQNNTITIDQLLIDRRAYLQQHSSSQLKKLAECLKLYDTQQVQSTLYLILSHLIDKKYTYLIGGILNAIAATLAANYARESNTLLIMATLIGLTNYSVFKTAEVIRVNKKAADEIYSLANSLGQDPQLRSLQGARIYGITHEIVVPVIFTGLTGYLLYLNWSDANNKQQATTWTTFSYLIAATFAHLLANGILTAFRNSALTRKQQLSNQLSLRIGSHYGVEINQQQAKDEIEALLISIPTLTALCMQHNYSLAETLLILDCCSRFHIPEMSQFSKLATYHLEAIKRNHNIYHLASNRLLTTDSLLKLTQLQLEQIDKFDEALLNYFQPANNKAVRKSSRLLWKAYANEEIHLTTDAHLKVFNYLFRHYSACCDIFKTRQSAIRLMSRYVNLTARCIEQNIPTKTISQYLKQLDKLNITADDACELKLMHLNALVSKSSNWAWLLEKSHLPYSQYTEIEQQVILDNVNQLNKEALDIYFQLPQPQFTQVTERLQNMSLNDIAQLNEQYKQAGTVQTKQQVINNWLNTSVFDLDTHNQPPTMLEWGIRNT